MRILVAASLVVLALGPAALAQPPSPAPTPGPEAPPPPAAPPLNPGADLGSSVVEALEVVAQPPGPALWKVTRGSSEVIVLGSISPLPHNLAWDTGRVDRALDGAKVLLVPPKPKLGALDIIRFMISGQNKVRQPGGKPMEDSLPPALRDRFVGARTAAHKDAGRYAKWKPFLAGFVLVNDYRAAAGLSSSKPGSTVEKLAAAHRVPVRPVAAYRVGPLINQAGDIPEKLSLTCLEDAVEQVQLESDHAQSAARAWAAGDLKGVRANYGPSPLEQCLQQAPGVAALIESGTEDSARAILAALQKPGKTVAVVDLNFLLRPNGVLDRLKAQGAAVSLPPG